MDARCARLSQARSRGYHGFMTGLSPISATERDRPRTLTRLALALAAGSLALLAGAWWFQLGLGLWPCKLCLQQRWPHYALVPLALGLAVLVPRDGRGGHRPALIGGFGVLAALMALSAGLGIYHAGVEWGWFAGPNDCGGAAPPRAASMQDFLRQLETARVVSCGEAAWRLGGLSLAGWNAVASLGLMALALAGLGLALTRPQGSSSLSQ
jgi:disulfide bond formation protein DsbB